MPFTVETATTWASDLRVAVLGYRHRTGPIHAAYGLIGATASASARISAFDMGLMMPARISLCSIALRLLALRLPSHGLRCGWLLMCCTATPSPSSGFGVMSAIAGFRSLLAARAVAWMSSGRAVPHSHGFICSSERRIILHGFAGNDKGVNLRLRIRLSVFHYAIIIAPGRPHLDCDNLTVLDCYQVVAL